MFGFFNKKNNIIKVLNTRIQDLNSIIDEQQELYLNRIVNLHEKYNDIIQLKDKEIADLKAGKSSWNENYFRESEG